MSNKINLLSFHHNRKSHYKVIADEIFNLINNFTDQEILMNYIIILIKNILCHEML